MPPAGISDDPQRNMTECQFPLTPGGIGFTRIPSLAFLSLFNRSIGNKQRLVNRFFDAFAFSICARRVSRGCPMSSKVETPINELQEASFRGKIAAGEDDCRARRQLQSHK